MMYTQKQNAMAPQTAVCICSRKWKAKLIVPIYYVGAIVILLRLFASNFIFGAEANISARAEVRHVIATKFQPG